MSQNRSSAVMAQRVEPHDSLDDFPTPPWGTRALVEHVLIGHGWRADQLAAQSVWEPAANRGYMARPLAEYFGTLFASDVHDYGCGYDVNDFLLPGGNWSIDWIISNPPFRLAAQFVLRGLQIARQGVAMLVRTSFAEGAERYRSLFLPHPPLLEAVFTERIVMVKGRLLDPNQLYWDEATGKWKRPATATSYTWMVWPGRDFVRTDTTTRRLWIPPERRHLERPGDYPDQPTAPAEAMTLLEGDAE